MSTADTTSSDKPKSLQRSAEVESPRPAPAKRKRRWPKTVVTLVCLVGLAGGGAWYWWQEQLNALPPGLAKANGRLEAEQVKIATKFPGRVAVVLAKEGQIVDAGEVVARMDTAELEAQIQAEQAQVTREESERMQAEAQIVQRESERTFAQQEFQRTNTLNKQGWATGEKLDQISSQLKSVQAAYGTALGARDAAKAAIVAGQAEVARLKSQLKDSTLVAPARGRIQYKLAQAGEVLESGGRV